MTTKEPVQQCLTECAEEKNRADAADLRARNGADWRGRVERLLHQVHQDVNGDREGESSRFAGISTRPAQVSFPGAGTVSVNHSARHTLEVIAHKRACILCMDRGKLHHVSSNVGRNRRPRNGAAQLRNDLVRPC